MKKKFISILLSFAVVVAYSLPCFADYGQGNLSDEKVKEETNMLIEDMCNASSDGAISTSEQREFKEEYSEEAIETFKEIEYEELTEAMNEMCISISTTSGEEVKKEKKIVLDCGAIVELSVEMCPVDEGYQTSFADKVKSAIFLEAYASSENGTFDYGTTKCTQKATVVDIGTAKIWLYTWVKASSDGLTITKTDYETSQSLWKQAVKGKSWIEDKYAQKVGYDCHSRGRLKHNTSIPVIGGTINEEYLQVRSKWKVTKIGKSSVSYVYTGSTWQEAIE